MEHRKLSFSSCSLIANDMVASSLQPDVFLQWFDPYVAASTKRETSDTCGETLDDSFTSDKETESKYSSTDLLYESDKETTDLLTVDESVASMSLNSSRLLDDSSDEVIADDTAYGSMIAEQLKTFNEVDKRLIKDEISKLFSKYHVGKLCYKSLDHNGKVSSLPSNSSVTSVPVISSEST